MFSEIDEYIIEELTKAGYGWEKYAQSVLAQGVDFKTPAVNAAGYVTEITFTTV